MICVFKKLFMYVSETRSKTILYNCKIYCISLIHLFKHKTNPKNRQPPPHICPPFEQYFKRLHFMQHKIEYSTKQIPGTLYKQQ